MPTIYDVARQAGVSISTVSRVLNGTARVNSEVKIRVQATMQALSYQPNPAARSLRTNHSRIIGLLIPDIQNPFFMGVIQGVDEEALRHKYSLILCSSNNDLQREQLYMNVLYSARVAGTIIVPTFDRVEEEFLNKFREYNIPIVTVSRRFKDKTVDAVPVGNNLLTSGSWDAIYAHGLIVPKDIELLSNDATPWSSLHAFSLTSVIKLAYELGRTSALQLFHDLQHPADTVGQDVLLTASLIVRESSLPKDKNVIPVKPE